MSKSKISRLIAVPPLLIWILLLSTPARPENWPRFRGPNGQGISHDKNIPTSWTPADYEWKLTLPGAGHSSPIVWGRTVLVTCSDRKNAAGFVLAIDAQNRNLLWKKRYDLPQMRMNRLNDYAVATPAADPKRFYLLWPTSEKTLALALDHKGKGLWKTTLAGVKCQHGPGTSPIIYEDLVVFTIEQEQTANPAANSAWIALDAATGQVRWQLPRNTGPKTSYSTPAVYRPGSDRPMLIFTSHSHGITAVDPRTGNVVWEIPSAFTSRVVSSPVISDRLIIATCGNGSAGTCLVAARPEGHRRATIAYKIEENSVPYVPTSIAVDGLLFTFHDRGQVCCLRTNTGELLWREKPAGRFYGSPVWVDHALYCISLDGDVVVLRAAPKYDLLAVVPLGEKSHATPAVADGRMYLRTFSQLFCLAGKKKPAR